MKTVIQLFVKSLPTEKPTENKSVRVKADMKSLPNMKLIYKLASCELYPK